MIISFTQKLLVKEFVEIVSETNGISLVDTLDLMLSSSLKTKNSEAYDWVSEYRELLNQFMVNQIDMKTLRSWIEESGKPGFHSHQQPCLKRL